MKRSKSPARRSVAACFLGLAPALLLAGCGGGERSAPQDSRPAVRVPVMVVRSEAAGEDLVLPGRVEAREEVTLSSRIAGRVTALPFPGGAAFREGATLVRFDAAEAREALGAADAGWTAARARLALARRQEARFESLYAAKVAALHELEIVRAERESAEAAERASAAAASERRAALEIRAPFSGVVVRRRADPGAEVGPGTPLLDIRSRESGFVVVAIPERNADQTRGRASIQIGDGAWGDADLVRLDGMIDPLSRTRTARYRPRGAGAALEAGAFARVRLGAAAAAPGQRRTGGRPGDEAPAYEIPASALVHRGSLAGVFLLRDGRASLRWIRAGRRSGDRVAILAGLDPGDTVAIDPVGLEDGRRAEAAR